MVIVVLSGLLGASLLAIALLAYGWKKNRADINRLHAEVTATKIAALSQLAAGIPAGDEPPEPTRRRKHLALYIGGGVAAGLASAGDRIRDLWRRHRTATASVTAAAAVTGAALYLTASGGSVQPSPRSAAPPASASASGTADPAGDEDSVANVTKQGPNTSTRAVEPYEITTPTSPMESGADKPTAHASDHTPPVSKTPPSTSTHPGDEEPAPGSPPVTSPPAPKPTPKPTPTPTPSSPPVDEPSDDCRFELLGLCLGGPKGAR
ncbi:hypothetical protein PV518_34805 [Streptomyces sp. ND04-05B]|uniref:hypothetical protein n=1 Tax=Streptomyces sp. ND04-05B TaxID=3028693 RepID=UPI0029BAA59C|nr:hypothetical protein [Streptomyces sp. ND04-05B]MDX3067284.1 hypothetical protein [Streptomyces sp. ND04-05B]